MSLLFVEGFEWLGTGVDAYTPANMLAQKYYDAPAANKTYLRAGRTGGYALEGIYNNAITLWPYNGTFPTTSPVWIVGFGLRPTTNWGSMTVLTFRKSSTNGLTLKLNPTTKEIEVYDRTPVLLGSTVGVNLTAGTWYYVEIKITDAVAGTVEIHVNGQVVCYLTNKDTTADGTAGYNSMYWGLGYYSVYPVRIDDLYVCNGAGSTNNDFLGNVQIRAIFPTSDGSSVEWGLSAGSDHYALVDEAPDTGDTDYVTADSAGTEDTYGCSDAEDLGTIHGTQINITMKEMSAAVVPTMNSLIYSNATLYPQTVNAAITTAYKSYYTINETDPATSAAWSLANLNAAEFGVKRV